MNEPDHYESPCPQIGRKQFWVCLETGIVGYTTCLPGIEPAKEETAIGRTLTLPNGETTHCALPGLATAQDIASFYGEEQHHKWLDVGTK